MNSNFWGKNLLFLRKKENKNQAEMSALLGFKLSQYNNWEKNNKFPNISDFMKICNYFGISETDFIHLDLSNANLNSKTSFKKNDENANLNAYLNANPNAKKEQKQYTQEVKFSVVGELENNYGNRVIPITDIRVAAGSGIFNPEYVENVGTWGIPPHLLKKNGTYLAVRIKGDSMAPTLQDDSYMIVRLLDRSEWANVSKKGERIYVITDQEGKAYLKRIKNRLQQGFIVLMSDNPDKASYPSFNLKIDEIQSIWEAEWYFSAKMPNIHDQYYTKLQNLENRVDDLMQLEVKVNQLMKRLPS